MSICLETNNVLASQVGTSTSQVHDHFSPTNETTVTSTTPTTPNTDSTEQPLSAKTITKLLVANHQASVVTGAPVLQKITNTPVITLLNSTGGPLTVVKTLCVTSGVSSTPQFTLVNSAPLTVTNAIGKSPTITLLNAPVTVVKTISAQQQHIEKNSDISSTTAVSSSNIPTIIENRAHNVFVKNTCPDSTVPDVPQSHKLLTANNFPQTNVLTNVPPTITKTVNGQRNKLKILSNIIVPSTPSTSHVPANLVLNKQPNPQQRMVSRQKVLGSNANGMATKYLNKPSNNLPKTNLTAVKQINEKSPQQRLMYPTHKGQIRTLPPINNLPKMSSGIKTLSPQAKAIPGQVQRTGSGLRTIPPQRPPKIPNKLNYIGKHAVQAQKVKHMGPGRFSKNMKQGPPLYNSYHSPIIHDKQLAFNQALTAEILETLSNKSGPNTSYVNKSYEILPNRYENAYSYPEPKPLVEPVKPYEDKSKSGLDALSLICQAVLLDHNYNATLPPDSPTRTTPVPNTPSQINGISSSSIYSPGSVKRRSIPSSNNVSSSSSASSLSLLPSNSNSVINLRPDDDAASDISDCSDRKHDTEGEETDTAPEAEAVNNDEHYDHYGDYVTRCICGFLHDDGYMVECDRCKVWQHVQCVVKNRQVPDEYLCESCDPTKQVDGHKARLLQQQWLRDRQVPDLKLRKEGKLKEAFKPKEVPTDSDSSDGENNGPPNNNTAVPKGRTSFANRRKSESHTKQNNNIRQKKDANKEPPQKKQFKRRERRIVKRKAKTQAKTPSEDENHDTFSTTHLPQLRQWIENYEEAVTNHYSPELRARISSIRVNGAHSDSAVHFDCSVHKCRVHTQPLTEIKYIVSTVNLAPNTPVIELRGKYMLSTQHRNAGGALTTRQHAQRPGPFLFFYRLHKDNTEVCVDTRTYGNSARFVRRSCKPNSELRHCIEKGVLHLYIVTIAAVEKNVELTIKHESHDLAVIGTTHIACYCGNADECTINKTSIKKNGETTEILRKRRGRRTASVSVVNEPEVQTKPKEEPLPLPPLPPPPPPIIKTEPEEVKVKKEEIVEVKIEPPVVVPEVKQEEIKVEEVPPVINKEEIPPEPETPEVAARIDEEPEEDDRNSPPPTPITTRRSSQKADKDEPKTAVAQKPDKSKKIKLSREERKLEAILRAIEQMEKADQRKQEHKQTKQAHRRESEPAPTAKEDEKPVEPKQKRKRRKGRARTTSTHSARRDRLNSGDSYFTSGDETLLSPNDGPLPNRPSIPLDELSSDKDTGLLMTLSNEEHHHHVNKNEKSPTREIDSNSNSAHSSPETPLSLACSLVQAAVEPLEPGFKFPKTKKVLMNEWLNKTPEPLHQSISPVSTHININSEYDTNTGFYTTNRNLTTVLNQVGSFTESQLQPRASAKKRWLRQAISEDKCDSPQNHPDSPPLSDAVAPPKKRRLPRESISNDNSPLSTPTGIVPIIVNDKVRVFQREEQEQHQEGCVEIVYSGADGDSPSQTLESDAVLKERAAEMKQEFSKCIIPPMSDVPRPDTLCLMDPRLSRDHHMFSSSDHLVGAVEKTLSILGFEARKPELITPAKRKLSITEYRQRKKLNNNDCNDKNEDSSIMDDATPEEREENNSSESFKPSRARSDSTSSSTTTTSSDDELGPVELTNKVPAFNSEPTELEREREMANLRLKKVLGLPIDTEPRKPTLDMEAILNCEMPPIPMVKPILPLNNTNSYIVPRNEEAPCTKSPSPPPPLVESAAINSPPPSPSKSPEIDEAAEPLVGETERQCQEEESEAKEDEERKEDERIVQHAEEDDEDDMKSHLFYTPDEDEDHGGEKCFTDIESVSYVPPFNNPVYPSTNYTSVIDEEGRYEGRNPSPPPNLDSENGDTHDT